MRNLAERTPHVRVLPLLVVLLGIGSLAAEAQQLPAPPLAPHPDSTGVVVTTQFTAMMLAGVLMDGTLRATLAADGSAEHHRLSSVGNLLGRGDAIAILLTAAYGGARVGGLEQISGPAGKTLAALLVAGAANGLIKVSVGRARPGVATEAGPSFTPFSLEDRLQSFPSGHAVTAFALAAAISEQANRRWVTGVSFGAATLVGWSRVYEDRHWTSDVVAGAIVGTVASKFTVRHLISRSERSRAVSAGAGASGPFQGAVLYPLPSGLAVLIPLR